MCVGRVSASGQLTTQHPNFLCFVRFLSLGSERRMSEQQVRAAERRRKSQAAHSKWEGKKWEGIARKPGEEVDQTFVPGKV